VGATTRAIVLVGAVAAVVLILALALAPRDAPAPTTGAAGEPTATTTDGAPTATQEPGASERPVAVLVGAGDIAECSPGADAETADLVESIDGIVFTLGDNAYDDGTIAEFRECYGPTWGRPSILERTRPVVGNHEYHTRGAAGYFEYFGAAAGDPDEGWYAFDAGAWRIYALNSNCEAIGGCESGSPQAQWLREDLAGNPRACVAALAHHPRFSSGEVHGSNDSMGDIWQILQDAGAELYLAGHEHSYERFGPQDAAGAADPERGLVQIVAGTGGRDPYGFDEPLDNSLVRASEVFGVLRLELGEDGYRFEFLPVPGEAFTDRGSGACH
jgi:acid phosphatase type 7